MTTTKFEDLGKAGMEAMRKGDAAGARAAFDAIIADGGGDAETWLASAIAREAMGDTTSMLEALDQVFKLDNQNPRALLMKGDYLAKNGDRRAALAFYNVLNQIVPDPEQLSPDAAKEVRRAKDAYDTIAADLREHLDKAIGPVNGGRFARSVQMMKGERLRFDERPRAFFFDCLPAIDFYDPSAFSWSAGLEAATDDIAAELEACLSDGDAFEPYIHTDNRAPERSDHDLLNDKRWSALYLVHDGVRKDEVADRFPKTLAALDQVPLEHIPGRGPMILFSRLKPGARIEPHHGFLNTRLICHLPIVVPPNCFLRVGAEVRQWQRGQMMAFSDAVEHEAWNDSQQDRIVMIFSIWRPALTAEERAQVSRLLQAVDSFQ